MAYNRHMGSKHMTLGEDTYGMDFKAFGDTTSKYILWDASADTFYVLGALSLTGAPTITGNMTLTGNTLLKGTVGMGTNGTTFTVAADGALAIATNKFTVSAAGVVTAAGALSITAAASATAQPIKVTATSASTSGSTSVESMLVATTLTGAGGVGGRARFALDTNVALGGWANALKAITTFGATGAVTGLGSALCAELALSAGTTAGTYAPLESELVLATGAKTGTATSFLHMAVSGDAASEFDTSGFLFYLAGVTANTNKVFQASAKSAICSTHALRVNVNGTPYFIPLHTSAAFGV